MPQASGVENLHPKYVICVEDWSLVRDAHLGERHVKSLKQKYLPATSGMVQMGMLDSNSAGTKQYEAYLMRAVFPDMIKPAVNALVGIMHREPAEIKLPAALEPMRENATLDGEPLTVLLRRMNEEQLMTGRVGLLVDVPDGGPDVVPLIALYEAETIINWDTSRREDGRLKPDLIVLDETSNERTDRFNWQQVKKFLVLELSTPEQGQKDVSGVPLPPGTNAMYRSQLIVPESEHDKREGTNRQTGVSSNDSPQEAIVPTLGGRTLDEIPFVFVGSIDLSPDPDQIPMLGLASLAMTIYRGEADYRHSLFMQGQDTLVTIGDVTEGEEGTASKKLVGAGALLPLPLGADAKYIGVNSQGLREQREALQNDRNRSAELGANLLSSAKAGSGREAAESLKIRVAARTATLLTVVETGAAGLEAALKAAAVWKGANPDEVEVIPNKDFIEDESIGQDFVALMTAKAEGGPISLQTIHAWMRMKDITELSFDEEMQLISEEEPTTPAPRPGDPATDADEAERLRQEEEDEEARITEETRLRREGQ
ncbi:MAG: DUF4055 domain-containing protein [Dehalococcoidales bacterium]